MRLIQLCFLALSVGEWIVSGQSTASISGKLVPELITTLTPNVFVTATKSGLPPFSQTVRAATNASFQISGLPAGTYTLCLSAAGFLNPCEWSLPTLIVTVGVGQSSAGNNLSIKPGIPAKLRIQDTSNLLGKTTKAGTNPSILAGVWTGVAANALLPTVSLAGIIRPPTLPTQFHVVHQTGADSTGANFEVAVPRDMQLIFHVTSGDVLLANSQGLQLAGNVAQQQFQYTAANSSPQTFSYSVIGLVAGK